MKVKTKMNIKAFPLKIENQWNTGMDLRDYFAAKIMQGLYTNYPLGKTPHEAAVYAYEIADAMIEAS